MRPTKQDLLAARGGTIPDVVGEDVRVVFCGINPSLWSAAVGHHFARPGNRFWKALHLAGFTERVLHPEEDAAVRERGLALTNLVARATATAAELGADELRRGRVLLADKVAVWRPGWVAIVGVSAYRVAFVRPRATTGPAEERIGGAPVWVLPNPSGLNAHWQIDGLAESYGELAAAAGYR